MRASGGGPGTGGWPTWRPTTRMNSGIGWGTSNRGEVPARPTAGVHPADRAARRLRGRPAVQGVVAFLLKFAPGVPPHYFERARRSGPPLGDRFEGRLRVLTPSLGDPTVEADPAWY